MIALTGPQQAALALGHVQRRIFVWCNALTSGGAPDPVGFWNDVGTVVHGGRTYHGSGSLVQVQALASSSDMSIPGLRVVLSGLPPEVAVLVRGSIVGQRPIEVLVGIFDVANHALIGGLVPRFIGVVDDVEITTPAAGGDATVSLTCESTSRALTISRTGTRSNSTQHERDATDDFYQYTSLIRERRVLFGRAESRPTKPAQGTRTQVSGRRT